MRKKLDNVNQMVETPASEVVEAMHAIMHLLRSRQMRGVDEQEPGLTPMEGKVLGFFARRPGATQSELAAHSGRDKGQLAKLIGGLRERGLLDARADQQDRRVIHLELTPTARQLHQALKRQRNHWAEVAMSDLSPSERATLLALLVRIQSTLEVTS